MERKDAEKLIRQLMIATQKFKSNAREFLEENYADYSLRVIDMVLADMYPWLFDEQKNILKALVKIVGELDGGRPLQGIDFYNVMVVFERFLPEVKATIEIAWELELPIPDPRWIYGWE